MAFVDSAQEALGRLKNEIVDLQSKKMELYIESGGDCNCECSRCSDAHEGWDEDAYDELEARIKEKERERLALLRYLSEHEQ